MGPNCEESIKQWRHIKNRSLSTLVWHREFESLYGIDPSEFNPADVHFRC